MANNNIELDSVIKLIDSVIKLVDSVIKLVDSVIKLDVFKFLNC